MAAKTLMAHSRPRPAITSTVHAMTGAASASLPAHRSGGTRGRPQELQRGKRSLRRGPAGPDAATASTAADSAPASIAVSLFPSSRSTTSSTFVDSLAVADITSTCTAATTPATTPPAQASSPPPSPAPPSAALPPPPPVANFSSALCSTYLLAPAPLADAETDADTCGGWCTGSLHCIKLCDADEEDEDEDDDDPMFRCARWCCSYGAGGGADASTTGDADAPTGRREPRGGGTEQGSSESGSQRGDGG